MELLIAVAMYILTVAVTLFLIDLRIRQLRSDILSLVERVLRESLSRAAERVKEGVSDGTIKEAVKSAAVSVASRLKAMSNPIE